MHHLEDIPPLITGIDGFHEMISVDGRPTLTFAGLSRLARHVIMTFVSREPKTGIEVFDWFNALPGKLTMQCAAQVWISDPQGYDTERAQQYLEGFVGQLVARLLDASAKFNDMRPVLAKVETLVPGLAKPTQRLPMLALYFLFNMSVGESDRTPDYPKPLESYAPELSAPSSISLAAHLLTGQMPGWPLPDLEKLHERYFLERHHAGTFNLGQLLEAAFTLILAEQNRLVGNTDRARDLVASAVELYPQHAGLRGFEANIGVEPMLAIQWQAVLLPRAPLEPSADQSPVTT